MFETLNRRGVLACLGAAGLAAASPALARPRRSFFRRLGKPLGVQLYALGEAPQRDMVGTLRRLAAIGYRDFELPGLYGRDPRDLRADAEAAGVSFGAIHMNMPARMPPGSLTFMSSPQEIADALGVLGIRKAVLPNPLVPDDFSVPAGGTMRDAMVAAVEAGGLDMWKRLADVLNERGTALKPHGIETGYHNHNMEFKPQGGTTGWEILLSELDPSLVFIQLDLGWISAAGLDAADELERLKGRVRMVHLKDIKASTPTNYRLQQVPVEVGNGRLDWGRILPACAEAGVQHYYVEQEPPFERDRFDSMKLSYDFLANFRA